MSDELIVFSPQAQKTVFAMFIDASDWWSRGEDSLLKTYLQDHNGERPSEELLYHGNSHNSADHAIRGNFNPGYRAYSKMYVGDYDNNGSFDIVKWQKIYRSNKKTESPAWVQILNEFTLYKRDATGEYLPQEDTSEQTIQGWLLAKNLTWQKGFPSKSECEGQEGQLIPEMHDPLLNDPEVLR